MMGRRSAHENGERNKHPSPTEAEYLRTLAALTPEQVASMNHVKLAEILGVSATAARTRGVRCWEKGFVTGFTLTDEGRKWV